VREVTSIAALAQLLGQPDRVGAALVPAGVQMVLERVELAASMLAYQQLVDAGRVGVAGHRVWVQAEQFGDDLALHALANQLLHRGVPFPQTGGGEGFRPLSWLSPLPGRRL
jgi:hypothetical protein